METNLTIQLLLLIGIFMLWTILPRKKNNLNKVDYWLSKNYHTKSTFKKKVVLIIESFINLEELLTLIRNILNQDIKIDSIILISRDQSLSKVPLIQNTCVLNKVGGLSFLLKESGNNTILIFIFIEGFDNFKDPHFLNQFLISSKKYNGLVKVETNSVNVDIDKVY
jgi:hypothetical protein